MMMVDFILKLPNTVTLQEGAHVTYLNNKLFEHNIYNGTIGIITKIIDDNNVEVTFPITEDTIKNQCTKNHIILQHQWYPCFEKSVPEPKCVRTDCSQDSRYHSITYKGQTYVTMSRATFWIL